MHTALGGFEFVDGLGLRILLINPVGQLQGFIINNIINESAIFWWNNTSKKVMAKLV